MMEETECPMCQSFNLTQTGVQKVSVTEIWCDGCLISYDVGDFIDWVRVVHYGCDDCGHKWEVEK